MKKAAAMLMALSLSLILISCGNREIAPSTDDSTSSKESLESSVENSNSDISTPVEEIPEDNSKSEENTDTSASNEESSKEEISKAEESKEEQPKEQESSKEVVEEVEKPQYRGENDTLKQYLKNVLSKSSYSILRQEGDVLLIKCPLEQESNIKSAIADYKGTDNSKPVLLQSYYTAADFSAIKQTVDAKIKEFGISDYTTTYVDASGVKVLINAACDTSSFIDWCSKYDYRKSVWVELLYLN